MLVFLPRGKGKENASERLPPSASSVARVALLRVVRALQRPRIASGVELRSMGVRMPTAGTRPTGGAPILR